MKSSFGMRLLALITDARMSQVDLARRSGISAMEVNHIIKGRRRPSFQNLQRLIMALPSADVRELIVGKVKIHQIPPGRIEELWRSGAAWVDPAPAPASSEVKP